MKKLIVILGVAVMTAGSGAQAARALDFDAGTAPNLSSIAAQVKTAAAKTTAPAPRAASPQASRRVMIQELVSLMDKVLSNEDLASYATPPLKNRSLDVGACRSYGADNYMERNFPYPPLPCVRGGIYLWMTPRAEYFKSKGVSSSYYQKVVGYPALPELVLTADLLKNTDFTVVTFQINNSIGGDGMTPPGDAYDMTYLVYKPQITTFAKANGLDKDSAQAASVSAEDVYAAYAQLKRQRRIP
ncbi:MAG TPA: hypothetical protein VNH15_04995 [Elusimicrobiota bacterium]|nr:hypothetical protein [Elusimicrobiota bacterium]